MENVSWAGSFADIALTLHLSIAVFVLAYSLFGLLVLAAWCYFPPRLKRAPGAPHK